MSSKHVLIGLIVVILSNGLSLKHIINKFAEITRIKSFVDDNDLFRQRTSKIVATLLSSTVIFSSNNMISQASTPYNAYSLSNDIYVNTFVNAPSDDFWYPPFMIGKWNTKLKFVGATFSEKVFT